MKKISKIMMSFLVAFSFMFSTTLTTFASYEIQTQAITIDRDNAPQEVKDLEAKIISFYEKGYRADIIKSLADLKEISPEYYDIMNSIINYWDWIETDMVENIGVAPDGIQNPAKHAFIVLGFALKSDGTMEDELIGRLEVAKASAEKYPESYVLVTGGVEKNGWTEGQRMHDWLVANGIAEERIIVEKKAPDTAGNATNSFNMLYKDYDVDSVSLITSQYHLKRGSILYYAESLYKAKELGVEPIKFIGEANAGWYRADKTSESMMLKAMSLRSIVRVPRVDIEGTQTVMQEIEVTGKTEYIQGEDLEITVKSIDSKGYNVDLTPYCQVEGFDSNGIGKEVLMVTYTQNGTTYQAKFVVNISIDTSALEDLYNSVKDTDLNKYLKDGQAAFKEALINTESVLQNPESKEQVDEAISKLNNAYNNLTLKATEETLNELQGFINDTKNFDKKEYTKETAKNIKKIQNEVKNALGKQKLTEDDAQQLLVKVNLAKELIANPDGEIK